MFCTWPEHEFVATKLPGLKKIALKRDPSNHGYFSKTSKLNEHIIVYYYFTNGLQTLCKQACTFLWRCSSLQNMSWTLLYCFHLVLLGPGKEKCNTDFKQNAAYQVLSMATRICRTCSDVLYGQLASSKIQQSHGRVCWYGSSLHPSTRLPTARRHAPWQRQRPHRAEYRQITQEEQDTPQET